MKYFALILFLMLNVSNTFGQTAVAAQSSPNKTSDAAAKNKRADSKPEGPITTEIYADEAFFDSNENIGIFTGRVKVIDPRFNLQSEKLTVYISKGEKQGLEKAIAEGNVAVVIKPPGRRPYIHRMFRGGQFKFAGSVIGRECAAPARIVFQASGGSIGYRRIWSARTSCRRRGRCRR